MITLKDTNLAQLFTVTPKMYSLLKLLLSQEINLLYGNWIGMEYWHVDVFRSGLLQHVKSGPD